MSTTAARVAITGALVAIASLAAPWWSATAIPDSRSPLEAPGAADGAIGLVAVAVIALATIRSRRPDPALPRPLGEGGLLLLAAAWLAALIALRAIDGPALGSAAGATEPRFGIALAAFGAGVIAVVGARLRVDSRNR